MKGSTGICIFSGIMKAPLYVEILDKTLLPFLHEVFPHGHRFMQDNDPKHTSRRAQAFFEDNDVCWWKTPPESPDANPIENLWHELKEFIRREVKPQTKDQLVQGIVDFWRTVDRNKCIKYIRHLRKVIPKSKGLLLATDFILFLFFWLFFILSMSYLYNFILK